MAHRIGDREAYELQVAAAWVARDYSTRESAKILARWYPDETFDASRVSDLVRLARENDLIKRPEEKWTFEEQAFAKGGKAAGLLEKVKRLSRGVRGDSDLPAKLKALLPDPKRQPLHVHILAPVRDGLSPSEQGTSFAQASASIVGEYLSTWNKHGPTLGVTWGSKLQEFAQQARQATAGKDSLAVKVVPVVGTPLGLPRGALRSSTRIAEVLTDRWVGSAPTIQRFDLSLIPAYIPLSIADKDLPAIYRLFLLVNGFRQVFGQRGPWGEDPHQLPLVAKLDFLITSISDVNQPYGFTEALAPGMIPFMQTNSPKRFVRPTADIGGVPLWEDPSYENGKEEAEFLKRWNGIRRSDMRACAERGYRDVNPGRAPCGVILLAPTEEKAKPTLLAIRSGLVNTVILGEACAKAIDALLKGAAKGRAPERQPR